MAAASSSSAGDVEASDTIDGINTKIGDYKKQIETIRGKKKAIDMRIEPYLKQKAALEMELKGLVKQRQDFEAKLKDMKKATPKAKSKSKAKNDDDDEIKMTEAEKKYAAMIKSDSEVAAALREASKEVRKNSALCVLSGFDDAKMNDHFEYNRRKIEAINNLKLKGAQLTKKAIDNEITMIRLKEKAKEKAKEKEAEASGEEQCVGVVKEASEEEDQEEQEEEEEEEEEASDEEQRVTGIDIEVTFKGRNNGLYKFTVSSNDTISKFKEYIWQRIHSELDVDKATFEKQFLIDHHMKKQGGAPITNDEQTFNETGIKDGDTLMMSGLGPKGGMAKRASSRASKKDQTKEEVLDAVQLEIDKAMADTLAVDSPLLQRARGTMNIIYRGAIGNPAGGCYEMFQQMTIPSLRKIVEVANGGNTEHKYKVMKSLVYADDLRNMKLVSTMNDYIDKGMDHTMKFITCHAYGDERGEIAWKTLGNHVMDIIGVKERAIGASTATPPAPPAPDATMGG